MAREVEDFAECFCYGSRFSFTSVIVGYFKTINFIVLPKGL